MLANATHTTVGLSRAQMGITEPVHPPPAPHGRFASRGPVPTGQPFQGSLLSKRPEARSIGLTAASFRLQRGGCMGFQALGVSWRAAHQRRG